MPSSFASRREWLLAVLGGGLGMGLGGAVRRQCFRTIGHDRIRPPGARVGDNYAATCIRCGQCVAACPSGTLRLASLAPDPLAVAPWAPDLRHHPCTLCRDQETLRCIAACPTGALQSIADVREIRMGTARIDPATCWAFNRIVCRSCWHACPWPDAALRLDERLRPVVEAEACVGCGLCANACPTEPGSVTVDPPANRPHNA